MTRKWVHLNDSSEIEQQAEYVESVVPLLIGRVFKLDRPRLELPVAQLRMCRVLQHGPVTMSVLSRELGVTVSATTQLADRLECAGLVERVPEPGDRRARCVRLTLAGAEMMNASCKMRQERWATVLARVSPQTRETFVEVLKLLYDASLVAFPPGDPAPGSTHADEAQVIAGLEVADRS